MLQRWQLALSLFGVKYGEFLMKMLGLSLIITVVLCSSSMPAFGELSVEDLEKIRQIVNETEVRLGKRIDDVEGRLGKRIDEVKKELDTRITSESEAQGKRITDLRDRIDFQGHLIIALIVAIIGFVAVPLSFLVYQYNKQREQQREEIETLRRRIEELERKPIIQA
jgi:polyhydroxyalkanoate synthesis regulator phasin